MNEKIYQIFCIGIIFFIFMTQCKLSKIQLKMKDASLILIFFALLAYINGYEILFVLLLLSFTLIYFTPQKKFDKYFSLFIKKESNEELNELKENTIDTIDTIETNETDIEIDDNITIDDQNDDQNEDQNENQNENQNDKKTN